MAARRSRHAQGPQLPGRDPATLDQMADISPFYSNKLKGTIVQDVFEKNMIQKNLDLLIRDGLVENENGFFERVGRTGFFV